MKPGLLSTAEVSHILKVNESTIKRWTDKGTLKCMKTPGGHRKYRMKDVIEFMDAFAYDVTDLLAPAQEQRSVIGVSADYAILTKDFPALSRLFFNTILEANRENTFRFLQLLYANRITQGDIVDRIVAPAFTALGDKWMKKELSVGQEHLASAATLQALSALQENVVQHPKHGGIALCGCLEGEYHDLGITGVNNVLEANGWTTYFLGPNTPVESFIDAVETYVPDIVCVSSTTPKSQRDLIRQCGMLRETTGIVNARLIVGGMAARPLNRKLPADHVAESIGGLMSYVVSLPEINNPANQHKN